MRDMAHAGSDRAFFARNAPGKAGSTRLFFPGCRLGGFEPDYVKAAYGFLRGRVEDTGIYAACCGAPAAWAGEDDVLREATDRLRRTWEGMGRPQIVCGCLTCVKTLGAQLPDADVVSLYQALAEDGLASSLPGLFAQAVGGGTTGGAPHASAAPGGSPAAPRPAPATPPVGGRFPDTAAVFDPCPAANDPAARSAVRSLVEAAGVSLAELAPTEGDAVRCCGFGGHVYPANEALFEQVVQERISAADAPYVTYCVNCNRVFRSRGKKSYHVLDLLFADQVPERADDWFPSISDLRVNRETLRADMLGEIWKEDVPMGPANLNELEIEIAPKLRGKLERLLIIADDIRRTIESCERDDDVIIDDAGLWTVHKKIGSVTYWVRYRPSENRRLVENAYCHRMVIEGEDSEEAWLDL
jgi:Fe-S oxidoreductase